MDRYGSYTQLDSPPLAEGDSSLVGVNSFDSAENLQPGQCQAAVNMDFTTQDAVTRGGFVCIPELGNAPFNAASTWVTRTSAADQAWTSITYGNGTYVAVSTAGGANDVMISSDAVNWTAVSSGTGGQYYSICYGNGLFVAVGLAGVVMTSANATTWTPRAGAAAYQWSAVIYGNGLFVAVNADNAFDGEMTSPDGITWTLQSGPGLFYNWTSVTYGNGLYVAVAYEGIPMTSPDGITWTARTAPNAGPWVSVAYGAGRFVAVAASGGTTAAMTSEDGITWTARTTPVVTGMSRRQVCFGNALFVAVCDNGVAAQAVMTSPDGITWMSQTAASTNSWDAVTNGNDIFVAVSITGAGTRVMTANATNSVWASGIYSDPVDPGSQWIMLVGANSVGFYSFGRTSRNVAYGLGLTVSAQSTIVQCNNVVYIFRGFDQTPLYWDGNWGTTFILAPDMAAPIVGFENISPSDQATYYQDRLWVIKSKDDVAASDVLDFTSYDLLADDFNLNTGDSNYLVTTYPFGTTTLVVFKNKSIIALTGVNGDLADVVATEITRTVGAIGINAVTSVGSDLVYMSDRNINLLSLTNTSNALQHQTLPLSTNLRSIMARVNWNYGYKVSMAYWDNKLYVSLPLDNATSCNTVVVYNFITQQWFGEWNFAAEIAMAIQGWAVATYLGATRLHCVTEDGRIFVTNEGQNDISGTTVAEIATSLTTRAYVMNNENRFTRRMYLDLATNRPDFSVTAYVEGASESTEELTDQTYSRADSWIFSDSTYAMNNSNDDYNRAFRKDYSSGPNSIQSGTGFQPEMNQEFRLPIITRRNGRLQWLNVTNSTGYIRVNGVGFEARGGYRSNLIQVG